MSFSDSVKKELARSTPAKKHCAAAELAAICLSCGHSDEGGGVFVIESGSVYPVKRAFALIKRLFNVRAGVRVSCVSASAGREVQKHEATGREGAKHEAARRYSLIVSDRRTAEEIRGLSKNENPPERECCRRAFLRGAFLSSGYIGEPLRAYHFEIVCSTRGEAGRVADLIQTFHTNAKIVARKGYFVVYIKDGQGISDALNIMGAHVSLMEFENIRIVREMRGDLNRKVNCETANMYKTVSSSVRQIEAIRYIEETAGLRCLSEQLRQTALIRLENPDMTLSELGMAHDPPIGKSGVSHRLKKICDIADKLKGTKQGG